MQFMVTLNNHRQEPQLFQYIYIYLYFYEIDVSTKY